MLSLRHTELFVLEKTGAPVASEPLEDLLWLSCIQTKSARLQISFLPIATSVQTVVPPHKLGENADSESVGLGELWELASLFPPTVYF